MEHAQHNRCQKEKVIFPWGEVREGHTPTAPRVPPHGPSAACLPVPTVVKPLPRHRAATGLRATVEGAATRVRAPYPDPRATRAIVVQRGFG